MTFETNSKKVDSTSHVPSRYSTTTSRASSTRYSITVRNNIIEVEDDDGSNRSILVESGGTSSYHR